MSSAGRTDSLIGTELDGAYRIVDRLGSGAMSTVYLANACAPPGSAPGEAPAGEVAIKVLQDHLVADEQQRERFEREARALFALQHPNILRVYDFGVVRGAPYLVMERLQGTALDAWTEQQPPAPDQAVELAAQSLQGLACAHAQGVLHRDVKTENIFVTRDAAGQAVAKLLDFGLVKFTDDERWGQGNMLTSVGEVFGTPAYMSPEQCTGAPLDARSDVYAMGVVLFELLTGAWPFMEEERYAMIQAHLNAPAPRLRDARPGLKFRPELERIIRTALAKSPEDRYADAGGMLAALRAVPSPAAVPAHASFPKPPRRAAGTPWKVALAVFVLCGLGLLGIAIGLALR